MHTCKICGNSFLSKIIDNKQRGIYYYCDNCDFIMLDPKLYVSPEQEKKRYLLHKNSDQDDGYVQMFEAFIRTAILPFKNGIKSALDFGCGPEPVLAKLLNSKEIKTDFHDLHFFPEKVYLNKKYDLLTCTEVLEHLPNPVEIIDGLLNHLKKKGLFAVMTLFHPGTGKKFLDWWYRRDITHVSFYNRKTINYLATKLNLEILLLDSKNTCVFRKI